MKEPLWYRLMWFFPPVLFVYFERRFHGWIPKFMKIEQDKLDKLIFEKYGVNK